MHDLTMKALALVNRAIENEAANWAKTRYSYPLGPSRLRAREAASQRITALQECRRLLLSRMHDHDPMLNLQRRDVEKRVGCPRPGCLGELTTDHDTLPGGGKGPLVTSCDVCLWVKPGPLELEPYDHIPLVHIGYEPVGHNIDVKG